MRVEASILEGVRSHSRLAVHRSGCQVLGLVCIIPWFEIQEALSR